MSCEEVQALLEEGSRQEEVLAHLATCDVCAAHAALLAQLRVLTPEGAEQKAPLVSRLPHPPWLWQKPATYLPLTLGLGFLVTGLLLSGVGKGLPAHEELGLLARTFWEVTGLAVGQAFVVFCRQAASAWGPSLAAAALALGVAGVLLLRWVALKVRA